GFVRAQEQRPLEGSESILETLQLHLRQSTMDQRLEVIASDRQSAFEHLQSILMARQALEDTSEAVEIAAGFPADRQPLVDEAAGLSALAALRMELAEHAQRIEIGRVGTQNLAVEARRRGKIARLMQSIGIAQQSIIHALPTASYLKPTPNRLER